jgi:hypothetical protein
MKFCDMSPSIISWSSEPVGIIFYNPLDKRAHRYYIDFYVITKDQHGKEKKMLVEVKPMKYVLPPTTPIRMTDKQTANYVYAAKQYIVNQAKFSAAREFCAQRGIQFGIITENFLFNEL